MSEFYYLISSLPMLRFGEKPPVVMDEFMNSCEEWISQKQVERLRKLSITPTDDSSDTNATINDWNTWETCLRNRIARQRGGTLKKDPAPYLRDESDWFSEIDRGVQEAFTAQNPKERERILNQLRWKKLEDAESGHIFDFDQLCVYKLKLMINEKMALENKEEGAENFNKIIQNVSQAEKTEATA